jgi:hypothetical protein
MKSVNRSKLIIAFIAFSMSTLLINVSSVSAYASIYPWNGYGFYDTTVGKAFEGIPEVNGRYRTAPEDYAEGACIGQGFFVLAGSVFGVGVDIYTPDDVDISVFIRGTYHLEGWISAVGISHSTAAIILRVIDHTEDDAIIADALLAQQIRFGAGSYIVDGNLNNSPSLVVCLEAGHEYWILGVARTALSIIGYGGGYAYALINVDLISVSAYPHGYFDVGGCPNLSVWDGDKFIDEGVLSIHNLVDPNADLVLNRKLKNSPEPIGGLYFLKLSEIALGYNYSHSYIDYVSLVLIDIEGNPHESILLSAFHSRYGNIFPNLLYSDDIWAETLKGDEITLVFHTQIDKQDISAFIFLIEGHNPSKV